jgi:hypothetical protein
VSFRALHFFEGTLTPLPIVEIRLHFAKKKSSEVQMKANMNEAEQCPDPEGVGAVFAGSSEKNLLQKP